MAIHDTIRVMEKVKVDVKGDEQENDDKCLNCQQRKFTVEMSRGEFLWCLNYERERMTIRMQWIALCVLGLLLVLSFMTYRL